MLAAPFAQNPATAEECADVEERYANESGDFTPELARLREELARLANVNLNAEEERDGARPSARRSCASSWTICQGARDAARVDRARSKPRRKRSSTRPSRR